jgi:hypothetical protein
LGGPDVLTLQLKESSNGIAKTYKGVGLHAGVSRDNIELTRLPQEIVVNMLKLYEFVAAFSHSSHSCSMSF